MNTKYMRVLKIYMTSHTHIGAYLTENELKRSPFLLLLASVIVYFF